MIPEEKEEDMEEDDEIGYQEEEREEGIKHDDVVECGGSIEEVRKIFTKVGNKEMAILKMEDLYGTYDVMVVPNAYEKFAYCPTSILYGNKPLANYIYGIGLRISLHAGFFTSVFIRSS